MDLHPGEDIIYEGHPSWRSIMSFYAKGTVLGILLGAIAWFAVSHGLGVAVLLIVVALSLLVGLIQRVFVRYTITTQRLHLKRGIIARNVQQTRIDRVQNVTTHQSIMDRLFRVGTVEFDTAGAEDANFAFAGVNSPDAVVSAVAEAQRRGAGAAAADEAPVDGLA